MEEFPKDWHEVERKYPERPKRTRITARFDEDVVKFFKRAGTGYQAKMNEVLRAYMFARLSKYVMTLCPKKKKVYFERPLVR